MCKSATQSLARVWRVCLLLLAATPLSSAHGADLRNFISDLYGGDGITLDRFGFFPHDAHFTESSLVELNQLGDGISSSLGAFSFNSTTSSFTFDLQQGIPVSSDGSLGPLLAERAGTIGQGRINFAVSFSRVDFDSFEGTDLDSLSVSLPHEDSNADGQLGPPPGIFAFEFDEVAVAIDATVKQDVLAFYGTLGLTNRWDVGVVVPVVRVEARANAVASIIDNGGGAAFHRFGALGDAANSSSGGSETGIGDLIVRTKYNFLDGHAMYPDMAVVGQVTLPTGDEDDLLGTGEFNAMGMLVASKTYDSITPHLNLGYEYSTNSDRSNLRYVAGFDAQLSEKQSLTASTSILGRWQHGEKSSRNYFMDLAVGVKWDPFDAAPINANFILPLNDEGLRSDLIWSVGIEYTF
jgi:hypothetical protein